MSKPGSMKFLWFSLFLVLPCLTKCFRPGDLVVNDDETAGKWVSASRDFDALVFPQKPHVIRILRDALRSDELNLSPSCRNALDSLSKGLSKKALWAYKFLDTSAKGQAMTSGYLSDFGDYFQCLQIKAPSSETAKNGFAGKYCMMRVDFPLTQKPKTNWMRPLKLNLTGTELHESIYEYYADYAEMFHYETFSFAICIPSTCEASEIERIIKREFQGSDLKVSMRKHCQTTEEWGDLSLQSLDSKVCLFIVIGFVAVVTIATLVVTPDSKSSLVHFSASRNTQKLFKDYAEERMQKLTYLDGYKFWYHTGACLAHLYGFSPVVPLAFGVLQDLGSEMDEHWAASQYLKKAVYTTQVIFLISGFFSCYYMLPLIAQSKGKLNFFSFAIKRWLRTAPTTFGVLIMLFASINFFHGPLAKEVIDKHIGNCRQNWWKTVFFMNNYDIFNDICIPQTWSTSVDYHLWILSYFPLIWLYKSPRKGIAACLALIAAGVVIPMAVSYHYALPSQGDGRPIDLIFFMLRGEYFPHMHIGTHNNISSYFVGILLGYLCANNIRPKNDVWFKVLTCSCITIFFAGVYGPYAYTQYFGEMHRSFDLLYIGVFRLLYTSIFAMFLYTCFYNRVWKVVDYVINQKFYIPLGRLAFSVYLAQIIPMAWEFTMTYEHVSINRAYQLTRFLSTIILCWFSGYIIFVLFEAPFVSISKTYLSKASPATTTSPRTVRANKPKGA